MSEVALRTVTRRARHEMDPVKGSRFITTVAPVATEAEAQQLLAGLRGEMPDASHHCSAWRIASPVIDRASDDGEPGGSAGRPMLSQLQGRGFVDTAVIVTRYFGGTKLGVGGLVRAYGSAAGQALDAAPSSPWRQMEVVRLEHSYAATESIDRALAAAEAETLDSHFEASVRRSIRVPVECIEALDAVLADLSAGALHLERDDPLG